MSAFENAVWLLHKPVRYSAENMSNAPKNANATANFSA
jgi:hypothetical protein